MSFAELERRRLAQLFDEVGPDAPTLCAGWTTRDLAAHLYVRENEPWGMFLGDAMDRHRQRDFTELVDAWRDGPSRWNPMRALDTQINSAEHFVHHEDVRRGGGEIVPRDFSDRTNELLRDLLARFAPLLLRGSALPVVLTPGQLAPITIGRGRGVSPQGDAVVRVVGQPGELLLWVYGRDAVDVDIVGDAEALRR